MKLDYDCVRDLLLTLEEKLQFAENMEYPDLFSDDIEKHELLRKYSKAQIAYTTQKLIEAGYIDAYVIPGDDCYNGAIYSSITFEGHQYLDKVRDSRIWENVKTKLLSAGNSASLKIIEVIAEKIIMNKLGF